ncbi:MAG: hypothetical protein KME64_06830 [Scytonematopsis contorta HA4267-MV1]|jgi:hypothetical protein|nr:hypothetical protein [Scytonematopsis contorta HA4267-MV1]
MKPNYEEMTVKELRAYAIEHRDDIEAVRILMDRHKNNFVRFPAPKTDEEMQEQWEVLEQLIYEKNKTNGTTE